MIESDLWLSLETSPVEADRQLQAALEDGSWRTAPRTWIRVASAAGDRNNASRATGTLLTALAARVIEEDRLDDTLRGVLVELANGLYWHRAHEMLTALCRWLSGRVSPGDASVVVELLGGAYTHRPESLDDSRLLPKETWDLAAWLLRSGAAELRQHGRGQVGSGAIRGADLLFRLALSANAWGTADDLLVALRLLLAAPNVRLPGAVSASEPWALLEKCLAHGLSEKAVVDMARQVRRSPIADPWRPLTSPDYPVSRRALLRLFRQGLLADDDARDLVQHLGDVPPLPGSYSPRCAPVLMNHLRTLMTQSTPYSASQEADRLKDRTGRALVRFTPRRRANERRRDLSVRALTWPFVGVAWSVKASTGWTSRPVAQALWRFAGGQRCG